MRALILRHGTVNRRLLLGFSPILLLWLVGALKNSTTALFSGFMLALVLSTFVILNGEAMDPNLERFILSLPVNRAQLVRETYVSAFLALLLGLCLPLLVTLSGHALAPGYIQALDPSTLGVAGLILLALACLITLMLPFRFALGGPKGLMAFSITLVAGLAGIFAWKGLDGVMEGITSAGGWLLDRPAHAVLGALGAVAFGAFSLGFSLHTYSRRNL